MTKRFKVLTIVMLALLLACAAFIMLGAQFLPADMQRTSIMVATMAMSLFSVLYVLCGVVDTVRQLRKDGQQDGAAKAKPKA